MTDAKAANDFAKSEYERAQVLYSREDISTSQRDQAKTKVDSTAAQLRLAEQRLALVQEGPRKEEIVAGARGGRSGAGGDCRRRKRITLKCGARKKSSQDGRRKSTATGRQSG